MNPNINIKNIKYIIISENEEATKKFESLCSIIFTNLKNSYNPRKYSSVKVNMTQELKDIGNHRIQNVLYEAIVEGFRENGWIVKCYIEKEEEIIYIQRHK